MQPSPYRPGEVAETVPGREPMLVAAEERLALMCDLGRLAGRVQVYVAPRGYGKTSLLREVQRRAEARTATVLWVTAGEQEGLIQAVVDALEEASSSWRDVSRLRRALEHVTVKLDVGVASVEAEWSGPGRRRDGNTTRNFEALLREAVQAARKNGHRALVLLVDEIQSADKPGLRTLGYAWQHFQAEATDLPVGVFAAGLPDAPQHLVSAVSFSERYAYSELEPLSPAAAVEALAGAARRFGVDWEPAALDEAVAEAAGYPYTVQLIGNHAWTVAGFPDAGATITAAVAAQACELTRQEMRRVVETRWARATPAERQFMSAMATLGDGPARRSDIAAALGMTSTQVSTTRENLLRKGVITPASYGYVEFAVPGMARYLRERVGDERG